MPTRSDDPTPVASDDTASLLLHATAVAWSGDAVVIRGRSGSGKSTLAAMLIDAGATLLADDRVRIALAGTSVLASAPEGSLGLLELRGRGLIPLGDGRPAPVRLVLDLGGPPERLPSPDALETVLLGRRVACQPVPADDLGRALLLALWALRRPAPLPVAR